MLKMTKMATLVLALQVFALSTKKSPNSQIAEDKLGYATLEFVLQVYDYEQWRYLESFAHLSP